MTHEPSPGWAVNSWADYWKHHPQLLPGWADKREDDGHRHEYNLVDHTYCIHCGWHPDTKTLHCRL